MNEAELMIALSKHISEEEGHEVVVTNFVLIADVLDQTGDELILMNTSNRQWANDLKMLEFASERTKFTMRREWKQEQDRR